MIKESPNLLVCFMRRLANVVAHSLARVANSHAGHQLYNSLPNCIDHLIDLEIMSMLL